MSTWETKGDVEVSGAGDEIDRMGDENSRMALGPSHEVDSEQKTLAFFDSSLMCDPTRRGLSK